MNQKTLVSVLAVLVLILGGTTVYFLTAQKSVAPGVQVPAPVSKTVPVAQDETAGWEVYRNNAQGYELRYPSGWYSYVADSSDVFFQPTEEVSGAIPGPHADALEIKTEKVDPKLTLNQIIKNKFDKAGIPFSQETFLVGKETGIKVISSCEGVGCGAPEWFILKESILYHFNSNLGYSAVFDQILFTFKFTK